MNRSPISDGQKHSIKLIGQWGRRGDGPGEFIIPNGITVLGNGLVLVVDCRNDRIQKFDKQGNFQEIVKPVIHYTGLKPDEYKNRFRWPEGISSDKYGLVWVADTIRNHRAVQIDQNGKVFGYLGGDGNSTHGSGNDLGSFLWPHGVSVSPDGEMLVVADTGNSRIQIFRKGHPDTPLSHTLDSSRMYLVRVVGEFGKEPGQFSSPAGVLVDDQYRIYVADYGNNRIQIFDQNGRFLRTLGEIKSRGAAFYHPYELASNSQGLLAVSDFGNNRIQILDRDGNMLFSFGREGKGTGEFMGPAGLAFDADSNLYVADTFNHRIQVFSFAASAEGIPVPTNAEEQQSFKRMDLPFPTFTHLGKDRILSPSELARWLAVDLHNDDNVYFAQKAGNNGYWGRGYFDWFPPFNTWSYHPLYRETAWRISGYIALHEITAEEEYREIALQALNYLVSEQPEDGAFRWWTGEEPSNEAAFFVNGVVGEALALGYEHFKEAKYLESLRRICDWALVQPTDLANTNYNSLLSHSLVLYYQLSGDEKYLEKALRLTLESVPPNMDEAGAMKDAHNRKTVYHSIVVRGLVRLLSALPAGHKDCSLIQGITKKMLANLEQRQAENGAFVSSPQGAEPDKSPFLVAPILAYCLTENLLGWEVKKEKINAAISYLAAGSSHHDDKFVMRDYLIYRYQTAGDRESFRKEFSRSLKKWRKKIERKRGLSPFSRKIVREAYFWYKQRSTQFMIENEITNFASSFPLREIE